MAWRTSQRVDETGSTCRSARPALTARVMGGAAGRGALRSGYPAPNGARRHRGPRLRRQAMIAHSPARDQVDREDEHPRLHTRLERP
jgi:hypothetical protein